MRDPTPERVTPRQVVCPFCNGKPVDTLAKVITETTFWRCLRCERTWTVAGLAASKRSFR